VVTYCNRRFYLHDTGDVTKVNALPAERAYIEMVVATLCVWFHDHPDA
jgi:hypothetical protein